MQGPRTASGPQGRPRGNAQMGSWGQSPRKFWTIFKIMGVMKHLTRLSSRRLKEMSSHPKRFWETSAKSYKFPLTSFTNIFYDYPYKLFHIQGKMSSYSALNNLVTKSWSHDLN